MQIKIWCGSLFLPNESSKEAEAIMQYMYAGITTTNYQPSLPRPKTTNPSILIYLSLHEQKVCNIPRGRTTMNEPVSIVSSLGILFIFHQTICLFPSYAG